MDKVVDSLLTKCAEVTVVFFKLHYVKKNVPNSTSYPVALHCFFT